MIDTLNKGDRIKSTTTGDIYEIEKIDGDKATGIIVFSTMDKMGATMVFSVEHLQQSPFWKKSYDVQASIKTQEDFISPEKLNEHVQIVNTPYIIPNEKPKTIDTLPSVRAALDWTIGYPFKNKIMQDGIDKKKNWVFIVTIDEICDKAVIVLISINGFMRDSSGEMHKHNPEYKMKLDKALYEELISNIPAFCDKYGIE